MPFDHRVDPTETSGNMESRFHAPGDFWGGAVSNSGAQATLTLDAGVGGQKRVVTGFTFIVAGTGLTPANAVMDVIDGATNTTTYMFHQTIGVPAAGSNFAMSGLNIVGSANTATTIEFHAAFTSAVESVGIFWHWLEGNGA